MIKNNFILLILLTLLFSCTAENFVNVDGTQFIKNKKPYHYIGTNYWYGAMLGADKSQHERLRNELDELKANGIVNLRILASSEGGQKDYTVYPATQPKLGEYDETLLKGLDFFLNELKKRDMTAIIYFSNNWEWSGGIGQYLEWNGYGEFKIPHLYPEMSWEEFTKYLAQFHSCSPCREQYLKHIEKIVNRKNTINGIDYKNDPAIMAWEIANEPRSFFKNNEEPFISWSKEVTSKVKSLDKNHLVTTGSEGKYGAAVSLNTFEKQHADPNIDYLTIHIWPKNWNWYNKNDEKNSLKIAIDSTQSYLDEHLPIAKRLNKPMVLEEFGFPREQESIDKTTNTNLRDQYYQYIFEELLKNIKTQSPLVSANFWGYGGIAKNHPENWKWNKGDDFTSDPPHEPQGLNSVFSTDQSTLELIKKYNVLIQK